MKVVLLTAINLLNKNWILKTYNCTDNLANDLEKFSKNNDLNITGNNVKYWKEVDEDAEHTHIIIYLSQYMGLNAKSTKKCYTRLLFWNGMISK